MSARAVNPNVPVILDHVHAYLGRPLNLERPVRVYRNLRGRGGAWSIVQGRLVVAHADALMLTDVRFVVSEAGVARVRAMKRRVVCAWAVGYVTGQGAMGIRETGRGSRLQYKVNFELGSGAFVCRNIVTRPLRVVGAVAVCFNGHGATAAYMDTKEL